MSKTRTGLVHDLNPGLTPNLYFFFPQMILLYPVRSLQYKWPHPVRPLAWHPRSASTGCSCQGVHFSSRQRCWVFDPMKSSLHFPRCWKLVLNSDEFRSRLWMVEAPSYSESEDSLREGHPAFCSVVLGVSVLSLTRNPLSICWLDGPRRGNWLRKPESQVCHLYPKVFA